MTWRTIPAAVAFALNASWSQSKDEDRSQSVRVLHNNQDEITQQ